MLHTCPALTPDRPDVRQVKMATKNTGTPNSRLISPIDFVVGVLDDCIGLIDDWFECRGIRPKYLIIKSRDVAIKIQQNLHGIGTPAGEPDFAKNLEEIRRPLSDYKNQQIIQKRLQVIEQRIIDVITCTEHPNAKPPSGTLDNMKAELEGLKADLVCWTEEKKQAELAGGEAGGEIETTAEKERNLKRVFEAIFLSLLIIFLFLISVWFLPVKPFSWLRNHPNSYSLQGSVIFFIPSFIMGLFKPQWRKWCWGTAALAFLVLIISLLGGKSHE